MIAGWVIAGWVIAGWTIQSPKKSLKSQRLRPLMIAGWVTVGWVTVGLVTVDNLATAPFSGFTQNFVKPLARTTDTGFHGLFADPQNQRRIGL